MRDIGKNIRQLRTEKNLTQDDLAERLFVTRQTVSNYETGKSRPDIDMLERIAEVLDTDIQTVIYGPEPKKQNPDVRRLVVPASVTALLGIAWAIIQPTAEELGRNTFDASLAVLISLFLKPLIFLLAGWTMAQLLGMALKKKPFRSIWAKRIGWCLLGLLALSFALTVWYISPLAPEWLTRAAYRIYVFFYRISVPYHVAFLIPGAALWLCGFPGKW